MTWALMPACHHNPLAANQDSDKIWQRTRERDATLIATRIRAPLAQLDRASVYGTEG